VIVLVVPSIFVKRFLSKEKQSEEKFRVDWWVSLESNQILLLFRQALGPPKLLTHTDNYLNLSWQEVGDSNPRWRFWRPPV
jgi:hypothetical protein